MYKSVIGIPQKSFEKIAVFLKKKQTVEGDIHFYYSEHKHKPRNGASIISHE